VSCINIVELTIKLLTQLAVSEGQCLLFKSHLVIIEAMKEQSTFLLKNFYKLWFIEIKPRYTYTNFLCFL